MCRITISLNSDHVQKLDSIGRSVIPKGKKAKRSEVVRYLIELGHRITTLNSAQQLLSQLTNLGGSPSESPDNTLHDKGGDCPCQV